MNPIEITTQPVEVRRAIVDALMATRSPLQLGVEPGSSTAGQPGQVALWSQPGEVVPRAAVCVKAAGGQYVWRSLDSVRVQETAPGAPLYPGLLWIRPSSGELFVRGADNTGWEAQSSGEAAAAVRYDATQELSPEEMAQARANIGVVSDNAVIVPEVLILDGGTPDPDFIGLFTLDGGAPDEDFS